MAQEPSAKDALSVLDFEPLAHKALPPAHWGYMSTGVDDDLTLRMNREAMGHYQIRARRLVGVADRLMGRRRESDAIESYRRFRRCRCGGYLRMPRGVQ